MRAVICSVSLLLLALFMQPANGASAVFAGGCFWCMEAAYQDLDGVGDVVSGFTGGSHPNPTYSGAHTGHYEAVLVNYDESLISYQDLLDVFWLNIDPFDGGGQFCDRGESYRPALFFSTPGEKQLANASRQRVEQRFLNQEIRVPVLPRARFFTVEEGHQDYYLKNPVRYKYYRYGCGRDKRLEAIWGAAENGSH